MTSELDAVDHSSIDRLQRAYADGVSMRDWSQVRGLFLPDATISLELVTRRLRLVYDRGPFTAAGLSVTVIPAVTNHGNVWRFGEPVRGDLGGTARTLDDTDGRAELEPGILSRSGLGVLDDSGSFVFEDDGWVGARPPGHLDLYVFAYGHDYAGALQAFYAVSGHQPVLPRWTLGNWWSRYHAYSAAAYYIALLLTRRRLLR